MVPVPPAAANASLTAAMSEAEVEAVVAKIARIPPKSVSKSDTEALKQLAAMELIELRPHRGAVVAGLQLEQVGNPVKGAANLAVGLGQGFPERGALVLRQGAEFATCQRDRRVLAHVRGLALGKRSQIGGWLAFTGGLGTLARDLCPRRPGQPAPCGRQPAASTSVTTRRTMYGAKKPSSMPCRKL